MATAVYLLCALTSLACGVLLFRAYYASRVRLLFWTGICFTGLAVNNFLLFVDMQVLPERDLFLVRSLPALIGVGALIYGLIWECE